MHVVFGLGFIQKRVVRNTPVRVYILKDSLHFVYTIYLYLRNLLFIFKSFCKYDTT